MERTGVILTVDIAVVVKDSILLIKRAKQPYMNKFALPGGHVEDGEKLIYTAIREAKEEINLSLEESQLTLLTILDNNERDPRPGRRVSIVYVVKIDDIDIEECQAGSDAKSLHLIKLSDLNSTRVGFDHWEAIKKLV